MIRFSRRASFVCVALLVAVTTVHAEVPEAEHLALIDLYNATDGAGWHDDSGWLDDISTVCSWFGVSCDGGQTTVISLELGENNLVGTLPDTIGDLDGLVTLDLSNNRIGSTLTTRIGDLINLVDLDLSDNFFLVFIPVELGGLGDLQHLDLARNGFSQQIPWQLASAAALQTLNLASNNLTGDIPVELAGLGALQEVDLRWNGLTTDDWMLRDFLNARQEGGNFEATQTAPPDYVSAIPVDTSSVHVSWEPIRYLEGDGGYRVYFGQTCPGPVTLYDETNDKSVSSMAVGGLSATTTYCFEVKSFTEPHPVNHNTVISQSSEAAWTQTAEMAYPGILQLSLDGYSSAEGETKTITVTRLDDVAGEVSIDYATSAGTATSGADYTDSSGTLAWQDGSGGPRSFAIEVLDDAEVEGDETVDIALSNPTGGAILLLPATAVLTISDNDLVSGEIGKISSSGEAPAVASDDAGNRLVVWSAQGPATDGFDVFARWFDPQGVSGPVIELSGAQAGDQRGAKVGCDGLGRCLAVWISQPPSPLRQNPDLIFARYFDLPLDPDPDPAFPIDLGDDIIDVDMAVAPAGTGAVLAWVESYLSIRQDTVWGIFAREIPWPPDPPPDPVDPDPVHTGASGDAVDCSVSMNRDGTWAVAYSVTGPADDEDVFVQVFDQTRAALCPAFRVNIDTWGDQQGPAVAVSDDGSFSVAWHGPKLADGSGDRGQGTNVYLQAFAADCAPDGETIIANAAKPHAFQLGAMVRLGEEPADCVLSFTAGGTVLVTQVYGCQGPQSNATPPLQLNNGSAFDPVYLPALTLAADGSFAAIWQELDPNEGDGAILGTSNILQNLGAGIFSDGFETGDTTAWTATVP